MIDRIDTFNNELLLHQFENWLTYFRCCSQHRLCLHTQWKDFSWASNVQSHVSSQEFPPVHQLYLSLCLWCLILLCWPCICLCHNFMVSSALLSLCLLWLGLMHISPSLALCLAGALLTNRSLIHNRHVDETVYDFSTVPHIISWLLLVDAVCVRSADSMWSFVLHNNLIVLVILL